MSTGIQRNEDREPLPVSRQPGFHTSRAWFLAAALVCLGFGLASQRMIQFAGPRETTLDLPEVRDRLAELLESDERYDAVFLGSSRVYRAIDPAALEAHAATLGCRLNAFNLGIPGLSLREQKEILQHLGSLDLQIEAVFLEPYSVANRNLDLMLSERRRRFYR